MERRKPICALACQIARFGWHRRPNLQSDGHTDHIRKCLNVDISVNCTSECFPVESVPHLGNWHVLLDQLDIGSTLKTPLVILLPIPRLANKAARDFGIAKDSNIFNLIGGVSSANENKIAYVKANEII